MSESSVKLEGKGYMQSTALESTVTGPGSLSFWWAINCKDGLTDTLDFLVDDWPVEPYLNPGPNEPLVWSHKLVSIAAGVHQVKWSFWQGDEGPGPHAGWIDKVTWFPQGAVMTFSKGASGRSYRPGQILTLVQQGGSGATFRVLTNDGTRAMGVGTLELVTPGVGYQVANGVATTVSPAGGTGCTINILSVG